MEEIYGVVHEYECVYGAYQGGMTGGVRAAVLLTDQARKTSSVSEHSARVVR